MQKRTLSVAISIMMILASIPQGAAPVMAQNELSIDQIQEEIIEIEAVDQEADENEFIAEPYSEITVDPGMDTQDEFSFDQVEETVEEALFADPGMDTQDEFSSDQKEEAAEEEKTILDTELENQKVDENEVIGEDVPELTLQGEDAAWSSSEMPAGEAQVGQYTTVTRDTHTMKSGTYMVTDDVTINPDGTGHGIQVERGAKVLLYIKEGKSLTVTGRNAWGTGIGLAAILLPEGSTLTVAGGGTLNATGGNAGNGTNGNNAGGGTAWKDKPTFTGRGGHGGDGGGGAGAGIGTDGGAGGAGGEGGAGAQSEGLTIKNIYGNAGASGRDGSRASGAGIVFVTGQATVNAKGGQAGTSGKGGKRGWYEEYNPKFGTSTGAGTSGGGGGGAGGGAADGIGSGGTGGGGGGGGASGNLDGEASFFFRGDLDDLWGYGGFGGSASWGAARGERGDYGASHNGEDTSLSVKHARNGGNGGSSADPRTVAFYTYSDGSSNPQVKCTSGHGVTRSATSLVTLQEFMNKGGSLVSSGTVVYDGNPHGVSVDGKVNMSGMAAGTVLLTRSDTDVAGDYDQQGSITLYGVIVSYKVIYYDASGNRVGAVPVMPGQYIAIVTFTSENPEYCGDWAEPFTIEKIQVEKPIPRALVFECDNWDTGEGVKQDAFQDLDETQFEFVSNAVDVDGTFSLRSAREAGSYKACFRLRNPETYAWAGESEETEEIWVPWSIALQGFDSNAPEVTYWGTAYDNTITSVNYTGEPIWVRPWWTPARDIDGRYPEWFTHWGSEDRPANDRHSSAVFYIKGEDDREGLIGYHMNADGSLEKVTAEQVYAWVFGVDVGGEHLPVENGDKVWYKTDADGWKVPLGVGEDEPEGAEGYVVARDYAYADHLGVKDPGIYNAYTVFDEGAGFASTSLAEATVEVRRRSISGAEVIGIKDKTYTGKALTQSGIKVVLNGKTLVKGTDYNVTYTNNKNAGAVTITIKGIGNYSGTVNKTFRITKATQKVSSVTPKNGATKKVASGESFTIKATASKEQGEAQFSKVSGSSKLKISSTGKVTVKKGLVKGKTYKLKYKVRIKSTKNFKATEYVYRIVNIKIMK